MLAKHVLVVVSRDMAEKLPATVFEHEVELLKDIHGDGSVDIVDRLEAADPIEVDADMEFDRLISYYGTNDNGQPYAERVFGRSSRGLEAHAFRPAKRGRKAAEESQPEAE